MCAWCLDSRRVSPLHFPPYSCPPISAEEKFTSLLLLYNDDLYPFFNLIFYFFADDHMSDEFMRSDSPLTPPKNILKKATHLNLSFRVPIWISHLIRRIGFVWATPSCLNSWGQIGSSSAFGFICALSSRMNSYLAGNNVDASNEENGHHVPLRLVNGHFRLPQFSYA